MDCKEFTRRIKSALVLFREMRKNEASAEAEIWLADNHYLLESEGKRVLAALKDFSSLAKKGSRVITLTEEYVKVTEGALTEESLDRFLASRPETGSLSAEEFDKIILCITGHLVCLSGEAVKSDRGSLIASAVTSIRKSDGVDLNGLAKTHCALSRLLEKEKTGQYRRMDDMSKAVFRERIAEAAKKAGEEESIYAKRLIETIPESCGESALFDLFERRQETRVALLRALALIFIPLALCALLWRITDSLFLSLALYLPIFSIVLVPADTLALKAVTPTRLLRLDPEKGIPEGSETAVVISCLLTDVKCVKECFAKLERHSLSNPDEKLIFGLLADLPDAKEEALPSDRAVKSAAKRELMRLEATYKNRFFLFLRPREFSETQQSFTGKERKRGAILEILRFMRGEKTGGLIFHGDKKKLLSCKYLLTLDSDTDLPIDTAKELVCIASHPENAPVTENGTVKRGYGIFAPRITTSLSSSRRTSFSRMMSGTGGASSYSGAVGDIYQDLYGKGLFSGKGLIDVDTALKILPSALPKNRILSHDIPEGCLLSCAYVSDVELTDGCPAYTSGWFKRLHRWTRGDIQNSCLLFSKRFDALSKYKLFDNIRRAFTFPAILLCFFLVPFLQTKTAVIVTVTAFLAMAPGEYLTLVSRCVRRLFSRGRFAGVSPALTALKRAFALTVTSAETAAVSIDAAFRGLYRLLISKRRLMEWSTAAQSDKGKLSCKRGSLCGLILILLIFTVPDANLISLPVAILWLASPLATKGWDTAITKKDEGLSEEDRARLENYASSMWRFFEDTLKEEYGFLPPDNLQLSPTRELALRTSPTNIGLALLSTVAARDLELIGTAEMTDILEKTLNTCVGLKKYKGNLYNWYSLEDLSVLSPAYLSSVDSGNFLCSLIALREAVNEYKSEDSRLFSLKTVIDGLIKETDLSVFADTKRNRFVTGLDEKGEKSSSAYDLLMSEALLTVYCGVALGQIPKKVFSSLGRLCGRIGNKTGALSWTGTMFEYFMPTLFLPVYKGSFISSSLSFALSAQKDRVKKEKVPWGISESGFYGFDPLLHYKYRAHGVQKAALCRGQDADLVISPYSTFLALSVDKEGALKNLDRLKKMGMYGEYGFYEAMDLTVSRTNGGMSIVESFMAHHVGMSMLAAANALQGDRFVKRFMSYPAVNAASSLLCEKIPFSSPVYRGFDDKKEKKPPRILLPEREYDFITPLSPKVHVMSGKGLTAVMTDTGCMYLKKGDVAVTAESDDLINNPTGVFCVLFSEGKGVSLTAAPDFSENNEDFCRQVRFTSGETVYFAHFDSIDASLSFTLSGENATGCVTLTVKNLSGRKKNVNALLYFEPSLTKSSDAFAHRAFEKLFLSAKDIPDGILFSRREGRNTEKLSLAVCHDKKGAFTSCLDRSELLKRPRGTGSLTDNDSLNFTPTPIAEEYFCPDLCCGGKTSVSLNPYSQKSMSFFFAVDKEEEVAVRNAREAKRRGRKEMVSSLSGLSNNRAEIAGLDEMCRIIEGELLPHLLFPHAFSEEKKEAVKKMSPQSDDLLWSYSVSGDLPMTVVELGGKQDLKRVQTFLRIHRHLSLCKIKSDLIFTVRDRHEYLRPVTNAVLAEIRSLGLEFEYGKKGGVFIIDVTDREDTETFLTARAAFFAPREKMTLSKRQKPFVRKQVFPVSPSASEKTEGYTVDPLRFSPKRPWCHILANECFGTLVSDRALGHTYAFSSRENRLTPWTNDMSRDLSGEGLILDMENRRYDIVNGAAATFTRYIAVWEGRIKTRLHTVSTKAEVSLVERMPVKKISVTLSGAEEKPFSLSYFFETAPDARNRKPIVRVFERNGVLIAENLSGGLFSGFTFLFPAAEDSQTVTFNCDRESFLAGENGTDLENRGDGFCESRVSGNVKGSATVLFYMGFSGTLTGVTEIVSALKGERKTVKVKEELKLKIKSWDKDTDTLVNEFLPHQISACRIRARTAFYQNSGARGFRDQLQDACAEVIYSPSSARQQILRAACRQFEKGDVLHWWQDRGARPPVGSRTRCSDDLVWLPYAVSRYTEVTGDETLLRVRTPYISGELPDEKGEKFIACAYSDKSDSVYDHCLLALRHADRRGAHGLLLMGTCDWNDGLSQVGIKGKGETVWGTMFLSLVCKEFAKICEKMKDEGNKKDLLRRAGELDKAWMDCFEEDRFLRAYDDNGRALGSKYNSQMEIDILPQSFSAILFPENQKSKIALDTAMKLLADGEKGIIRLFTPPFDSVAKENSPGYIAAYPKGIRENGGQYTHGAIWFLFALARQNRIEDAWRLTEMISPFVSFERRKEKYGGEPYYMAADVSSNECNAGEAGWTMYTGAAGWYYRLLVEELYGIKKRGDRLFIEPRLPKDRSGFSAEAEFQTGDNGICKVSLTVKRTGQDRITVNGRIVEQGGGIPLTKGKTEIICEII